MVIPLEYQHYEESLLLSSVHRYISAMLMEACNIEWISPEELDEHLSMGWFRGRGILFKAGLICFDGKLQSTLNVRIPVHSFAPKKTHRKLLKRNRKRYRIIWGTPQYDESRNLIYREHSKRFKEYTYESIDDAYMMNGPERQFEEYECSVYCDDELVAISYVDVGARSMASIMCCFKEKNAGDSLGIYTMLEELEFARSLGLEYYYPGYVMDGSSAFDYKLSLAPVEWLTEDGNWRLGNRDVIHKTLLSELQERMHDLHERLSLHGIDATLRYYPFFAAGFINTPFNMLDLPAFFLWQGAERTLAAGYDLDAGQYLFFEPIYVHEWDEFRMPGLSDEFMSNPLYEVHFIKADYRVYFEDFSALFCVLEEISQTNSE